MKIIAIDDSETALKLLINSIAEAKPLAEIYPFSKPSELLIFAKENPCDIAFLDIQLWSMTGLEVAKELKEYNPKINIIFVTAYSEYASQAFEHYPSGYVLKPVTKETVEREIKNLRYPVDLKSDARLYAQTFGNFEVFSHGTPLKFERSKTKELLAYLIDRNGAAATTNELCAVLWEEKPDTKNLQSYFRKLVCDLHKSLRNVNADDILIKKHNNVAVIPEKIVCDSYGFMRGDTRFVNAYKGQYMAQYTWAEFSSPKFGEA